MKYICLSLIITASMLMTGCIGVGVQQNLIGEDAPCLKGRCDWIKAEHEIPKDGRVPIRKQFDFVVLFVSFGFSIPIPLFVVRHEIYITVKDAEPVSYRSYPDHCFGIHYSFLDAVMSGDGFIFALPPGTDDC